MRKPERKLARAHPRAFRPDAILSTYPLYPYFTERIFSKLKRSSRVPVFTVVTDSIAINAAWRKAPTDFWLVTDQHTKDALTQPGTR